MNKRSKSSLICGSKNKEKTRLNKRKKSVKLGINQKKKEKKESNATVLDLIARK